jgi:hypothetical protein
LLAAAFTLALLAADIVNLTGTWRLNVAKSDWGKKPPPQSVVVQVQHNEPELKYSGTSVNQEGGESAFDFAGTLDGRERPSEGSYGPGKITLKRVNPFTISSEFRTNDGKYSENTVTTVSQDGKTVTRRMSVDGPDGKASWTEVYDKQ